MLQNLKHYEMITIGGRWGHLLRRLVHLSMLFIPIAYYYWADPITAYCHCTKVDLVAAILFVIILAECIRLKKKYLILGQRAHEAAHVSSFAWGGVAICIVLLLVPKSIYAIPIIAGCAIGDPLIGILKPRLPWYWVRILAFAVIGLIWWIFGYFAPLPGWFPWVISAITVVVEWPNFYCIDDNALMQLVPLAILLIALR